MNAAESVGGTSTLASVREQSRWLARHEHNIHSQTGEDGVLGKIFTVIGTTSRVCVEVGAWDGLHGSNTRALLAAGWQGVQIECHPDRFRELAARYRDRPDVRCLDRRAWKSGPDALETLLNETGVPPVFDLLSIDIDGNDYHLWAAIERHRPRVVVIEYNFSIPDEVSFVQPADPGVAQGSSLRALVELGRRKGYELVHASGLNAVFVEQTLFPLFHIRDNSIEVMHVPRFPARTHVFFGYDGTVFVRGAGTLPWHDLPFSESRVQMLPRPLRKHDGYGHWKRLWFLVIRAHLRGELLKPAKWVTALKLLFSRQRPTNVPGA